MEGYFVWCGSAIKVGNEYHLFAARWPKETKFPDGYFEHSEIVRAVSRNPLGPYQFKEVVVGERDPRFWDSNMAHNPTIHRVGGTYVLFYIGSDFQTKRLNSKTPPNAPASLLRRVGYATAPAITGPWTRSEQPAIPTESNNPALLVKSDGSVQLLYRDSSLRTFLATARSYAGPYEVVNDNVWPESRIEDFYFFTKGGRTFLLSEDNVGGITGHPRWGALLVSDNGVDRWRRFEPVIGYDHDIEFDNGEVMHAVRRERPQLIIDKGRITHLITAVYDGTDTWSQPVPLAPDWPPPVSASVDTRKPWKKVDLNPTSPFEAVGAADFDGDGDTDVFSGEQWYEAPQWAPHKVREVAVGANPHYRDDFANIPLDVNADGKPDLVTCNYFGKYVGWVENPGDAKKTWIEHEIDRPGASETCRVVDVNGDGKPDIVPNTNNVVVWYELVARKPEVKWKKHLVSENGGGHGLGVGDVDGDGRQDLVGPKGWYQQPAAADGPWTFHAEFDLGKASVPILVRDVDGDGLADLIWGMGHDVGLNWLQQKKTDAGRAWKKLEIDTSFSQPHTLLWADLDGRGIPVLVTGKRIYAHEGETGATDAPGIYAYRFDRKRSRWNKQVLYQGKAALEAPQDPQLRWALKDFPRGTAGTGLDIAAVDMDADGDIDLVCPGKSGLYLFENPRLTGKARPRRPTMSAVQ